VEGWHEMPGWYVGETLAVALSVKIREADLGALAQCS